MKNIRQIYLIPIIALNLICCQNNQTNQNESLTKSDFKMIATRDSWKNNPMPEENVMLEIDKQLSSDEMTEIMKGLRPVQMEDKWFIFSENNTIYFHRSWTGACIYQADFIQIDSSNYRINKLTINRKQDEYKETDSSYDLKLFSFLVDRLLLNKSVKYPDRDSTLTDEQKMIERHSSIGYGQTRKELNE